MIMGLIPVGDSDFFFVPRSCCHVDQFTFHISLSNLRGNQHPIGCNTEGDVSTRRNGVAKLAQHAATNNVAISCLCLVGPLNFVCDLAGRLSNKELLLRSLSATQALLP